MGTQAASSRAVAAVILAAGKGTRMRSELPKVLHPVAGLPLLHHVIGYARAAGAAPLVTVVGFGAAEVKASVKARFGADVGSFALQKEQRGTGHALRTAMPLLRGFEGTVLVLCGDLPLVRPETLTRLCAARKKARAALAVGTVVLTEPGSYGRIVRDEDGQLARIVEAKDASAEERALREINTGLYAIDAQFLRKHLGRLTTQNAQGEYYLTDLVALAAAHGGAEAVLLPDEAEVQGVNTLADLATAQEAFIERRAHALLLDGVSIASPRHLHLDADVSVAPGAKLAMGAQLYGRTIVEAGASVGPNAVLRDVRVGKNAVIGAGSVLTGVEVGDGATVAPLCCLGTSAPAATAARAPSRRAAP